MLARGDESVAAGRYDEAEKFYMEAMLEKPSDPQVIGRLGVLFYNQGRIIQGYAFLGQAIEELPDNIDFRLSYALACYTVGKTVDARNSVKKVLETRPTDPVALLLLAETCVSTRDNEEARRIVGDLRSKHGEGVGFHVALGALQRMQRDYAGAEKELKEALALDPKSFAAHDQLSMVFAARGEAEQAAASLQTAAHLAPPRAAVRLRYISHLVRANARDEASKELATILAQAPDCLPALIMATKLAVDERRLPEATAHARKVLERDRTNYDGHTQLATIKYLEGDFDGVVAQLKQAEEFHSRAPQIKLQIAAAYLRKGENHLAEEILRNVLVIAPNNEEAVLVLADLLLQKGDPLSASAFLEPLAKRRPDLRRAQVLYARACFGKGDEQQAFATLQALVKSAPNVPDNHYLIGLALANRDPAGARKAFENTVMLADNHWPAQEMLVDDDLGAKRTSEAARRVEALIEKYPQDPAPLLLRASIHMYGNDLVAAESDLLKALELDPDRHHTYLDLAKIYFVKSRGPEAVTTMAASAAKTNSPRAFTQLGMLQSALGQTDAARQSYEKALALADDFTPALNNLALLYAAKPEDREKALKLARHAHKLVPGDPQVADTLGWILFLQGQYAGALPLLQSAAEKRPAETGVLHHLAMTHYYLEQEVLARQMFERVIASGTDSPLKDAARRRLAVLAIDPERAPPGAKEELSRHIAGDPTDFVALFRLGAIEARDGDPRKAAELLESALKVNPRSVRSLVALMDLYSGPLPDPARERELAKVAQSVPPGDSRVTPRLGRFALRTGDFPWAVSLLQEATRMAPEDSGLRFNLAQALYGSGRVTEAESALSAALGGTLSNATRDAARGMAAMLTALKRPAELAAARPEADRILAQEPGHVPALMVVAADFERQQGYRDAQQTYDKILALNAGFPPALRQLALLYAEQLGDDGKAEDLAVKARRAFPDDPDLSLALGSISYRRGDYTAAVNFLRQSWRQRDDHAQTAFLLGMCQFSLKNASESRTFLERALQLKLPPQETSEAERILNQLSGNRLGI